MYEYKYRLYPFTITVDGALCAVPVGQYHDKPRRVDVRWCVDGHYGDRCEEDCSNNCDTRGCDRTSGNCTCKPGYRPPLCKQECSDGHYGDRCEEDCSDNCDTPECDKTSGNCTCKAGYQPPLCKQECNDGQYGHNCGLNCSANCTDVCDSVSGNCTCNPGFMPPLCDQELIMKDNAKSLTWPIVGAASGGGLLLAGIVTVIVCWRRRRQAKRSNNGGQIVSSAFELSPPFAKDLTKGSVDATEETSSTHGKVGGLAVPEESGENYYEPFYVSQNYDAVHHVYTDMKSHPRNQN
ncbi:multiple epidermal growth factor-like domains protein 11 [Littorina saxatilis]|uniref:multiple epidermal growth factor-like domains protein 11 n=1 Tax=Littorina saxatilis TaxID=31220 RepID=UPI0038B5B15F